MQISQLQAGAGFPVLGFGELGAGHKVLLPPGWQPVQGRGRAPD